MTDSIQEKFSLRNKTAVVTGGAGLIGKTIATGLAQAGAMVYIADIDKQAATSVLIQGQQDGVTMEWVHLDISDETSIKNCVSKIVKKDQSIDIWVNCAYPRTKDWGDKFEDIPLESWRKNVDMHLNGYIFCCKHAAEQMKNQNKGSIINFGSIYGCVAPDFSIYEGTSMTSPAAYSAIKGGIINFTRYLSAYYGKYCIRANVICPGGIFDHQPKSFVQQYEKKTPLGRMGNPEDLTGPVVFLASDASSYITGQVLLVDGGWTVW